MFCERSVQRIFVGASNAVSSNSRVVLTPASLTVLANTVPTPGGPSVVLRISSTRGLNSLSFSPSARNAKTSSIGRSTTAVPSNLPPAIPQLFQMRDRLARHEPARDPRRPRARAHGVRERPPLRRDDGHLSPSALRDRADR